MDISISTLRLFRALTEHGSFTGAARASHVTQSAVSRAVQSLEATLDTELVVRTTRHVELTAAGEEFSRLAERVLHSHDSALDEFAAFRRGDSGRVQIATTPVIASLLLPSVIASFREQYPAIDVRVSDLLAEGLEAELRAGRADIVIAAFGNAFVAPAGLELEREALLEDNLLAVLAPSHPLASADSVTWEQLVEQPLVMSAPGSSVGRLVRTTLAQLNLPYTVHTESWSMSAVAGMVAAGLGNSVAPAMAAPTLAFSGVVLRPLVAPQLSRTVGTLRESDRAYTPAAQRFLEALRVHGATVVKEWPGVRWFV